MFKLMQDPNTVRTLSVVTVDGYEPIPEKTTFAKGHRFWATYEAWLAAGNTPEPFDNRSDQDRRLQAKDSIDRAAGEARARFISEGSLVDQEYMAAETAAKEFKAAGYPSGDVPESVQSWADATGNTPQWAADDIIATGQQWRQVLTTVRSIRLAGKAQVDAATGDAIATTADQYVAQLEGIMP